MKKKIIFIFLVMGIVGCASKKEPPKPPKPINDISEHILYHTGTITNIYYHQAGSKIYFYNVQYDFDDGSVIRMRLLKCDHLPKIGEYGNLYVEEYYKSRNYSHIQNGSFLWIKDGAIKRVKKIVTPKVALGKEIKINDEYKWNDASSVSPDVYKLVIIRLDNKIITTGRLDDNNEWQIETDKGKRSFNKYSNFKVVEWKKFDKG